MRTSRICVFAAAITYATVALADQPAPDAASNPVPAPPAPSAPTQPPQIIINLNPGVGHVVIDVSTSTPHVVIDTSTGAPVVAAPAGGLKIPVTSAGIKVQAGGAADILHRTFGGAAHARVALDNGTQRNNIVLDGSLVATQAGYIGHFKSSAIPFHDTAGDTVMEVAPVNIQVTSNNVTAPGAAGVLSLGLLNNTGVRFNTNKSAGNEDFITISGAPFATFIDKANNMQTLDGLNAVNVRAQQSIGQYVHVDLNAVAGMLTWLSNANATQVGVGRHLAGNLSINVDLPKNFYARGDLIADNTSYKLMDNVTHVTTDVNQTDLMATLNVGFKFDIGHRPPKASGSSGASGSTTPAQ
jgi:hypothetical protein